MGAWFLIQDILFSLYFFFRIFFLRLFFFFPRDIVCLYDQKDLLFFCLFANGIQILLVSESQWNLQTSMDHMNLIYFHQNKKYFLSFLPILKINILRRCKIFFYYYYFISYKVITGKSFQQQQQQNSQEKQWIK